MPDPSWSDATRNDIFEDLGYAFGLAKLARALAFWLHPQNNKYLVVHSDETAHAGFTLWNITACEPGVDTDADGWIYWKYTDAGATGTLEAYRGATRDDSSGHELVATSGSVANSTSMTLTPETGYAFAGTVMHGVLGGSFNWRSQIIVPARVRGEHLWDNTSVDDSQIRAAFLSAGGVIPSMRSALLSALGAAQGGGSLLVRTKISRLLKAKTGPELITPGIKRSSFAWIEEAFGLLEDLRQACVDNTGGSGAIEAQGSTLAGAVAYGGPWDGTAVTPTYGQRGVPADITLTCKATMTASSPPRFEATRAVTDTRRAPGDGTQIETLDRPLYIGSAWKAPEWGIESLTINYLASVANVTSALLATTASLWSVSGLRTGNSNAGIVYGTYVTADTTLRFYRTSAGRASLDSAELVGQVTLAITAINTAFSTDENDSGIIISGTTGNGDGTNLVNLSDGDVNFNVPVATSPASYATIAITETTAGGEWVRGTRDGSAGAPWKFNHGAGLDVVDGQILRGIPFIHAGVYGDLT